MADDVFSSLITAVSGLGGVYLGAWLTTRRDDARDEKRKQHEQYYLAALLGAHLDQYAAGCLAVAYDDGTSEGRPAGHDGVYHQAVEPLPIFDPLTLAVEWKSLPADLMYAILALPSRGSELSRMLDDPGFYDPPEFSAFFHTRQLGYVELGLDVLGMARRLRELVSMLPPTPPNGRRSPEEMMHERREQLVQDEIGRNRRFARSVVASSAMPEAPVVES